MIGRRNEKASSLSFRDLMLALNAALSAVLILILPNVNPASEEQQQSTPGSMWVQIDWPSGSEDVDIWVTGPGLNKAVGYKNQSSPLWDLLRDDRGLINDPTPINVESAYTRGLPAGEYIINVHCFTCAARVPVRVVAKIVGGASIVNETVTIAPTQEITVIRFKIDGDGNIVPGSQSKVYEPLRPAS